MKTILFLSAVLALGLSSCSKEFSKLDEQMPSLKLISPAPGSTYQQGDTIKLLFDAEDNIALKDVHVILENQSEAMELIHIHDFTDQQRHTIEAAYIIDFPYHASLHLGIKAMDQLNNYVTEEINLLVNANDMPMQPVAGSGEE